ncbi:efflux RND transporter periplasmic adaptor subunit [Paenibacillus mendelii]|uniref:Efflux RND transporter periplasmic adaptor subunit n=1 Tax=Paenibacillus mendelii TaxID=206163 RepID=A0ABV6JE60_9BACL|nr:biotin/lipoyl-binding protein [Paenibacillus mendelii]MCQ6557082.1 biotin/lipoyl-binding protein [Paenibacillus mendelii]
MKQTRQRAASILLISFFVLMAGLTLFSHTFQTAMLPKATTENPHKKTLSHVIKGTGPLTAIEKKEINSVSGGKIATVHVKKNMIVRKGQVLITLGRDNEEQLRQQLLEAEVQLKKQSLNQETLRDRYIAARQAGDDSEIRKAKRDLQLDQLDMDLAQRKIEGMRKDLEHNSTVTAPYDGRVSELQVEDGDAVSPGQSLLTLVKSGAGFELSLVIDEAAANLLQTGSQIPVLVKKTKDKLVQMEGTVFEIREAGTSGGGSALDGQGAGSGMASGGGAEAPKPGKTVVVHVPGDRIQENEEATVSMEIAAKEQGLVVRKELLKKDGQGSYVFLIREKKRSLGNTYTAEKVYVTTGDEINGEVIILQGLTISDNILTESSEPLQEGNHVRLY